MHGKPIAASRVTSIKLPRTRSHRPKRIDLVVTDCEFGTELDGLRNPDSLQPEFRCTFPVALLSGTVTAEALREAAHFCRPQTDVPISERDLLRLIEQMFSALKEPEGSSDGAPQTDPSDELRIARLTPRELQVLEHVVAGDPNKRTAAALNISRRTVEHHRAVIMQKTHTKSVPDLVRLALRTGLFSDTRSVRD